MSGHAREVSWEMFYYWLLKTTVPELAAPEYAAFAAAIEQAQSPSDPIRVASAELERQLIETERQQEGPPGGIAAAS